MATRVYGNRGSANYAKTHHMSGPLKGKFKKVGHAIRRKYHAMSTMARHTMRRKYHAIPIRKKTRRASSSKQSLIQRIVKNLGIPAALLAGYGIRSLQDILASKGLPSGPTIGPTPLPLPGGNIPGSPALAIAPRGPTEAELIAAWEKKQGGQAKDLAADFFRPPAVTGPGAPEVFQPPSFAPYYQFLVSPGETTAELLNPRGLEVTTPGGLWYSPE